MNESASAAKVMGMKRLIPFALLFAFAAGAAHAQVDYVGSWIGANDLRRQVERSQDNRGLGNRAPSDHARGESADTVPRTTAANTGIYADALRQLRYTPSAAVSAHVNASMADALAGLASSHPSSTMQLLEASFSNHPQFRRLLARQIGNRHDEILNALNAGILQRRFRQRMQSHGYSAENIADVNNAFLIDAWSVVNPGKINQKMAFSALQQELRRTLADARTPPPRLSAETMQENTEALALLTMLVGAARHNAGTRSEQASLQAGVGDIGRRMGIELQQVALTEQGFTAR